MFKNNELLIKDKITKLFGKLAVKENYYKTSKRRKKGFLSLHSKKWISF